jgi:signal transduction histidine kinase
LRTRADAVGRRMGAPGVLIEVENGGPALNEEVLEQLFTPFFTTKSAGSGLGLPVTLRIVREHGATLNVSTKDGSTVFSVRMPLDGGR